MYVIRNEDGVIVGAFASLQPGIAEEFVDETSRELIAFYESLSGIN